MTKDPVFLFFQKSDEFLKTQFDHAQGSVDADQLMKTHADFISFAQKLRFSDPTFEEARKKWCKILEGTAINLGFRAPRDLPKEKAQLAFYLNKYRLGLSGYSFNSLLKEFSDLSFDRRGLGLSQAPQQWLKTQDVPLATALDPVEFKNRLFAFGGHLAGSAEYKFVPNNQGRFFMMALNLVPIYYIGYGAVTSLFSLSTLAHEIGHTTAPRNEELQNVFLAYPSSQSATAIVNNENESYLYEKIFLNHVREFVGDLQPGTDLRELLLKRKAIQYNLHVLANHLNSLFFAGVSLEAIAEAFRQKIHEMTPGFYIHDEFEWLNYASLDLPLSKVGLLRAYQLVFKEQTPRQS